MASFTLSTFICIAFLSCISWAGAWHHRCNPGWAYLNRRCVKYFPIKRTWIDAERECVRLGGHLASERCPKDHFLHKNLQRGIDGKDHAFWIGLSDSRKEGTWIWSVGRALRYTKWNYGEPNNAGGKEHCVVSNAGYQRHWNDISCHYWLPYICVKRPIH